MKKVILLLMMFYVGNSVYAQQLNTDLLSNLNQYPSAGYNDIWGYTDPSGREYALLGVNTGTSVIDITDPYNPRRSCFCSWTEFNLERY